MSRVALVRCESYEYNEVKNAVQKGIELLGGADAFVKPGEKILLKPNWLVAEVPDKCATTHPMVIKAVAEVLLSSGTTLTCGDSPAFQSPESVARKSGAAAVMEELGITLADFDTGREVFYKDAMQNKKIFIANGALDCDGIVSLPKLKTHALARVTGSVKNQFGCIPGALKGEFHVRLPNVMDFSKMLIDINMYLKPRLYVMDGIYGMEGNGPRGGDPKKMGILLLSADPIALDATVCRIIGLDPEFVPTTKIGQEAGLGVYMEDKLEIVGETIQSYIDPKFDVKREPVKPYKASGGIQVLRNIIVPKPYINENKCIKCGICSQMCPVNPKALDWHDGNKSKVPSYIYDRCIRCYCCQELCPESAIHLKTPLLRRIFRFIKPMEK